MDSTKDKKATTVDDEKDLNEFHESLKMLRSDFDAYTTFVRTKSLHFCTLIIVINWVVFGKLFENGKTFSAIIKENYDIKRSIFASITGILIVIIYNLAYSIYLKVEDSRIQKDFAGKRVRFLERRNPKSSYPYSGLTEWVPLLIDILIVICAIGGFYYFGRAIKF